MDINWKRVGQIGVVLSGPITNILVQQFGVSEGTIKLYVDLFTALSVIGGGGWILNDSTAANQVREVVAKAPDAVAQAVAESKPEAAVAAVASTVVGASVHVDATATPEVKALAADPTVLDVEPKP